MAEPIKRHTISLLVDNEPGVLARVVGLFSGRGYNIESLTVAEVESGAALSRINLVTSGPRMIIEQIKAQLDRLVPVHKGTDMTLDHDSVERELALVKVAGEGEKRVESLRLSEAFRARVIDTTHESFVFELTGALAVRDIGRVTRIVQYMRANPKMHPVPMVMPILTLYFSRLLAFHHLEDQSQTAASKSLKVHPYAIKEYTLAAKNYPPAKLARIFGYIRACDKKSKGMDNAATSPYDLLQEALFKTLH